MVDLKLVGFQLGFDYFRIHYIFAAAQRDDLDLLRM